MSSDVDFDIDQRTHILENIMDASINVIINDNTNLMPVIEITINDDIINSETNNAVQHPLNDNTKIITENKVRILLTGLTSIFVLVSVILLIKAYIILEYSIFATSASFLLLLACGLSLISKIIVSSSPTTWSRNIASSFSPSASKVITFAIPFLSASMFILSFLGIIGQFYYPNTDLIFDVKTYKFVLIINLISCSICVPIFILAMVYTYSFAKKLNYIIPHNDINREDIIKRTKCLYNMLLCAVIFILIVIILLAVSIDATTKNELIAMESGGIQEEENILYVKYPWFSFAYIICLGFSIFMSLVISCDTTYSILNAIALYLASASATIAIFVTMTYTRSFREIIASLLISALVLAFLSCIVYVSATLNVFNLVKINNREAHQTNERRDVT